MLVLLPSFSSCSYFPDCVVKPLRSRGLVFCYLPGDVTVCGVKPFKSWLCSLLTSPVLMISSSEPHISAPRLCRTFHPIYLLRSLGHRCSRSLWTSRGDSRYVPLISLGSSSNLLPVADPLTRLCLHFSLHLLETWPSLTQSYATLCVSVPVGIVPGTRACASGRQRSTLFYETVVILKLPDWARLTGSKAQGPTSLCPPSSGITGVDSGA